jgi:hypothetical protein
LPLSKSIGAKDVGPNAFPVSESMVGYDPLFVRDTGSRLHCAWGRKIEKDIAEEARRGREREIKIKRDYC